MRGNSFFGNRVDPDQMCSTSFGVKTGPPALSSRDDVLVENGAAAEKLCLSPLEMRSPTAADGLHLAGKTSIATWTTFDQSTLWLSLTENKKLLILILYACTTAVQFTRRKIHTCGVLLKKVQRSIV